MQSGIVKWFNNSKGFGFIVPEGGGADIFAHYSAIEMDGYKTLRAGQAVAYDTINGPKGLHAANIHVPKDLAEAPAKVNNSEAASLAGDQSPP
jgi:CspA family cold shock protein